MISLSVYQIVLLLHLMICIYTTIFVVEMENKEHVTNSIRLLFARHGETEANFTGVICGQQPGKLTTLGEEQAQKIGVYFSKENITFDFIYVSDLARTVATFNNCKSRAQHLEKVETKFIPLIRERCGGILEGQPLNIWKENAEKEGLDVRVYKCEKGESWCDVNTRCFAFLKLLVEEHLLNKNNEKETRIFAVVHQGFLMEFYNLMRMLHGEEP